MIRCTQVIARNAPTKLESRGECQAGSKAAEADRDVLSDTTSAADSITLDQTSRHRRRLKMVSDGGIAFLLDLAEATQLCDGDHLLLDDARRILVRAEPEPLYEVRGHSSHHLLGLTWHMGNRHLPTQIMKDHLRIRRDPVIARMLELLGGEVRDIEAAFDPQGGAYDASTSVAHTHASQPGQTHNQPHDHTPAQHSMDHNHTMDQEHR